MSQLPRSCVLLVITILMIGITLHAEEKRVLRKDMPPAVLAAFEASYPKAKITAMSSETEDSVTYFEIASTEGKVQRDVTYAADGNLISVETTIAPKELPLPVSNAIVAAYPDGKIKKAESIAAGGETTYEVLVKSGKKYYEVVLTPYGKITGTEEKKSKDD